MDAMKYALKGKRQGFEIKPTDETKHCPDGYTEVRRGGQVIGVYLTALLA
jgi:hypothetical protein